MKKSYWLERWKQPQQGFDQQCVNRSLELWYSVLNATPGDCVFVPLCGKAYDLFWLSCQGLSVIGVELSDKAIRKFFDCHSLQYESRVEGDFVRYSSGNITVLQGDYFAIKPEHLTNVNLVYDRAALVAFPADMRRAYIDHMTQLFDDGMRCLLVSLEFDADGGPPFSLSDAMIDSMYAVFSEVKKLGQKNLIDLQPSFQEKGCQYFYEKAHFICL